MTPVTIGDETMPAVPVFATLTPILTSTLRPTFQRFWSGPETPAWVSSSWPAPTLSLPNAASTCRLIHPMFYAGVGIHPMQADQPVNDAVYAELKRWHATTRRWCAFRRWAWIILSTSPDHEVQDQVFRQHIHLAKSLGLPVIFHSRESHPAVFKVLREENAGLVGGAMHYFQGDEATAREAIDCGFFISLARPLTRLPELQEVARNISLEHIVLETDAFPQPFKKYRHNWTDLATWPESPNASPISRASR